MSLNLVAGREVFSRVSRLFATVCLLVLASQTFAEQPPQQKAGNQPVIERVDFINMRRVESGKLRALVSSGPGHPYSAEQVERDAEALRDTGFFDEVRSKAEDSPDQPNAKVVIFYLTERPVIRRIEFRGFHSITEEDILQAFNEKKVRLSVETYFDHTQLAHAEAVIKELLAAHGHPSAKVKATYEKISRTNAATVTFNVDEGPKTQSSKNLP